MSRLDPKTGDIESYNASHGLQANEFNLGAHYRSPSGELFFGGINGLNAFFPETLVDNPHAPLLALTDFKIFEESVVPSPEAPLTEPIATAASHALSHHQNDLSFDFVGLHFSDRAQKRYQFKLDNYDEDWRPVRTQLPRKVPSNEPFPWMPPPPKPAVSPTA